MREMVIIVYHPHCINKTCVVPVSPARPPHCHLNIRKTGEEGRKEGRIRRSWAMFTDITGQVAGL